MRMILLPAIAAVMAATAARADGPAVAVDIPPVHALVAQVMAGVGEPDLILPAGASPHTHALRPSEAGRLERADAVFWIGEGLTPWFGRAIGSLAPGAKAVALLEVPGTTLLGFREGVTFEAHDHDHGRDHGHGHDRAAPAGAGGHHEAADPHAWLDPVNAAVWLDAIAATLAGLDPANADTYRANAAAAERSLDALAEDLARRLAPVRGRPYVVFHDAYHYFEARFGIEAAGALYLGDAARPGPARVAGLRRQIRELGVVCVFAEPQFQPALIRPIVEGTGARSAHLDPIGAEIPPGPDLYRQLLVNLADNLIGCLGQAP